MIRKPLPLSPEDQIRAYRQTRMRKFFLGPRANPVVRGAVVDATLIVQQMRANHELGILETLILGHAYIGVLLMTSQLKGHDTISLSIRCDGPAQGLYVEANAFGEVRGYLKNSQIEITKPVDPNEYSEYFGRGTMELTRTLEGGKRPFTSTIEMKYGSIAQDLAYYYTVSEQTPSAFHLSIRFDETGQVIGAGGLTLQTMPNTAGAVGATGTPATESASGPETATPSVDESNDGNDAKDADDETADLIRRIENQMMLLPSFGSELAHGKSADDYLHHWFENFGVVDLDSRPVEFTCHCSEDRFVQHLKNLPATDREDIRENGPFPLVLTCHNCNSRYEIGKETLLKL